MSDPILTIRIPRSSWQGIIVGIEKWVGRSQFDDIEILSDYEVVDPPEFRVVASEKVAEVAAEYADEDDE
jgi:hypothetical protein